MSTPKQQRIRASTSTADQKKLRNVADHSVPCSKPRVVQPILDYLSASYRIRDRESKEYQDLSVMKDALQRYHDLRSLTPDRRQNYRKLIFNSRTSSSFLVRVHDDGVFISGNPTQWIQGHNYYTTLHPQQIRRRAMKSLMRVLGLGKFQLVPIRVSRMDLTHMVDCGSAEQVRNTFDRFCEGISRRKSCPSIYPNSLVFNQFSRQLKTTIYVKSAKDVLTKTSKPIHENCLRLELTLRNTALKRAILNDKALDGSDAPKGVLNFNYARVFDACFTGFKFAQNQNRVEAFPVGMISVTDKKQFVLWRAGQINLLGRSSQSQARSTFRKKYGIDLSLGVGEQSLELQRDSMTWEEVMDKRRWVSDTDAMYGESHWAKHMIHVSPRNVSMFSRHITKP